MPGNGWLAVRVILAWGVAAAVCGSALPNTAAQVVTPTAVSFPVTPDPADCVIAPRALEEIVAIAATPVPEAVVSQATPFMPPAGEQADAATAAAVTETIYQVFACANAGAPLRFANLYTDRFLGFFFGGVPTADVEEFLALPPQPLPQDQQRIIRGINEVQVLPDGRAGVTIILDEPDDPRSEEPDYVILQLVDGRWLIDEVHEDTVTGA